MSEGETTKPENEATETPETPETPAAQTGDIINHPTTDEDFKRVKKLGWFLLIIPLIIILLIIILWPDSGILGIAYGAKGETIIGLKIQFQLWMILLVLLGGALGSYIHIATSYSYYIGFNKFDMDWFWWYWLRIPIGAVLALIFLTLIQGGMFKVPKSGSETQPVTLIGLSALVGMFSRQATEKLKEVFDIIFKSREREKNEEEQDKKNKPKQ